MKARLLLLGCMVASLLLPGCKDDKEVIVSGITVSPATIPALEIGETVELTATITPDYATEEIRWVAYDKDTITTLKAITLESDGRRAILKAVKAGAAKVFVTNRTGVVVSDEVLVTVNSDDYAGFVAGKYVGTAELSGALSADLSDVSVTLERIENEKAQVKLTVVAEVPTMGELTITGEHVYVEPGTAPDTYALSGTALLDAMGGIALTVAGTYRTDDQSLTLSLDADNMIGIHIAATPGAPEDYGAAIAGDYAGTAQLAGAVTAVVNDVQVAMTRLGNSKAALSLLADVPGLGKLPVSSEEITLSVGSEPNTCTLGGKAQMPAMNMEFNVMGTFHMVTHALTIDLVNEMETIHLEAMPVGVDPSDYAAVVAGSYLGSGTIAGAINQNLSGVQIVLEKVDNETVKIGLTADITGMGPVTIDGDAVTVSKGDAANTYVLNGTASGVGMSFGITGTFHATSKELTLKLEAAGVAMIDLTAEPTYEKY